MKKKDINPKSDSGLNSEKKKVCKSFADLSQLMDWVVDGHQSCEILQNNGEKAIKESGGDGNE